MPKRPRTPTRDLAYGSGSVVPRNGKWVARWFEGETRRAKTFPSKEEAEDFLRDRRRRRERGQSLPATHLTVADLIEDWLERSRDDWKPTTYATNHRYAHRHVIPAIGHLPVEAVDPARIQHWIDTMRRDGLGPRMIGNCTRVVGSAYRQAILLQIVRTNPVAGTKRPSIRQPAIQTWTDTEIRMVDAALAGDPMWHAVYRLALSTGMRPGELRALQWADIDLERGSVRIRRTVTRDHTDRIIVGESTKTGRERTVALAPHTADALRRWRKTQGAIGGFVFASSTGGPLGATTWHRRHAALIDETGVTRITLHELRHTFATQALERGIHPKVVQDILGHASIEMTLDRYSHVSIDLHHAAANALDAGLFTKLDAPVDSAM